MESRHARQYRLLIEDLAAKYGAETPEQREGIYERARRSNERLIETHRDKLSDTAVEGMRRTLEDIVAEFDAAAGGAGPEPEQQQAFDDFDVPSAPQPVPSRKPRRSSTLPSFSALASSPIALGAAAGVAGMAILLLLLTLLGAVSFGSSSSAYGDLETRLDESRPAYENLISYMERLETALRERISQDPDAVEAKVGSKLVYLADTMPDLVVEGIEDVPQGIRFGLRATRDGLKITASSLLCSYARLRDPQHIDPKRDPGGVGCSIIAVYDEGGRDY